MLDSCLSRQAFRYLKQWKNEMIAASPITMETSPRKTKAKTKMRKPLGLQINYNFYWYWPGNYRYEVSLCFLTEKIWFAETGAYCVPAISNYIARRCHPHLTEMPLITKAACHGCVTSYICYDKKLLTVLCMLSQIKYSYSCVQMPLNIQKQFEIEVLVLIFFVNFKLNITESFNDRQLSPIWKSKSITSDY